MKMKRFATLLIVALAGMAMMFAATTAIGKNTVNGEGTGSKATTDVTLTVTPNELQTYHFGFSQAADVSTPESITAAESIGLTSTEAKQFFATNDDKVYVFFNVRTNKSFKLSIAEPKDLAHTTDGDLIPINITFGTPTNGSVSGSPLHSNQEGSGGIPWVWSLASPNGALFESVEMNVKTRAAIPLTQKAGDYKTTLTLEISIIG